MEGMKPNATFQKQPKSFWAQVKSISQGLGYSKKDRFNVYTIEEITAFLRSENLTTDHLVSESGEITTEGQLLVDYFIYRAETLETVVEPSLMNREQAKAEFDRLYSELQPTVKIPYNKQKGDKRHHSYLTGLVNMLTEQAFGVDGFNPDPQKLAVITKNEKPLRTLARRVDGAYPSLVNPIAIWEVKEYYGTTTFGSRVADGVYETMLDGYELEELRATEDIEVKHYLFVDDHFTWWVKGKSYLCRMFDMVHEGFLDEVIVGRQVVTRWPEILKDLPSSKATTSTVESREHLLQS